MASNYTENYQLCQWEATDAVQRLEFNADNAKIDAELGSLATTTAKCGNCQIYTTTYIGTNQYGPSHANTLSFPHKPMVVAVSGDPGDHQFLAFQGVEQAVVYANDLYVQIFTWSGNTLSWYRTDSAYKQFNQSRTYYVTALLDATE